MSPDDQKKIEQISNKELFKDFFEAITDIEKKLLRTIKELTLTPEKVIYGYIGSNRNQYISVFRYFLFTIFIGYISYEFFYQPQVIGGPFYLSIKNGIEVGFQSRDTLGKVPLKLDTEAFNIFYIEYTKMMTYLFKLTSCFTIPAIYLSLLFFFKELKLNIASRLVASTFLASQTALFSYLFLVPLSSLTSNVTTQSYALYIPLSFYLFFAFTRLAKRNLSKTYRKSLAAALFSILIFFSMNMIYGASLYTYVRTYTPKFAFSVNGDLEKNSTPDSKKEESPASSETPN